MTHILVNEKYFQFIPKNLYRLNNCNIMYKIIFNVSSAPWAHRCKPFLVQSERKCHAPDIGVQSKCTDPRRSEASQDGDMSEVIQKQAEQEQNPVAFATCLGCCTSCFCATGVLGCLPCDLVSCRQRVLTSWLALFDPCGFPWWASILWHVWFSTLCLMSLMSLS